MGRLVESVKAGPTSTSAVVWIFVFLALGTFAVWKYYSSAGPLDDSARWIELRQATHNQTGLGVDLERIAKDSKGRMQARVARYQLARVLVKEPRKTSRPTSSWCSTRTTRPTTTWRPPSGASGTS